MDVLLFHEDLQKPSKSIETSKKSLLEIFCMVTLNILSIVSFMKVLQPNMGKHLQDKNYNYLQLLFPNLESDWLFWSDWKSCEPFPALLLTLFWLYQSTLAQRNPPPPGNPQSCY